MHTPNASSAVTILTHFSDILLQPILVPEERTCRIADDIFLPFKYFLFDSGPVSVSKSLFHT